MQAKPDQPEPEGVIPEPAASPAPLDIALVHANVSSLRADMSDGKVQLAGTQEDVRKILLLTATKNDVERVLRVLDSLAKRP